MAASSTRSGATVAVLRSAPWSPGNAVRDGAGEFAVLMQAEQLRQAHRSAGLVAIGDKNGMLRSGGERALRYLVFTGVTVVKLALGGSAAADGDAPFLHGFTLSAAEASTVLAGCLERYGSPPAAADPEQPTARELAAIRAHLQPFQTALSVAAAPRVVSR